MPSRDVRDVPRVPALVRAARGEPVRGRKVTRLIGKVSDDLLPPGYTRAYI